MSLFPSAYAAGATTGGAESSLMQFLPMIVIFVIFYFLLIRPQQKKAKQLNQVLSSLQKGDEVATSTGLLGKIVKINDKFAQIEIAENTIVTVQKSAISGKLEKGTIDKAI